MMEADVSRLKSVYDWGGICTGSTILVSLSLSKEVHPGFRFSERIIVKVKTDDYNLTTLILLCLK